MRLLSLTIGAYRGLTDLTLTFPQDGRLPVYLLVGVNGTGKTAILRVLTRLLNDLDDAQAPPIPFELVYERALGTEIFRIEIRGDGKGTTGGVKFLVTDSQGIQTTRERGEWRTFLPTKVVIYTSGSVDEWEQLIAEGDDDRERREQDHTEALHAMLQNTEYEIQETDTALSIEKPEDRGEKEPSRLFLIAQNQLQLILLATLAFTQDKGSALRDEIYQRAGITRLTHFNLHLKPEATLTKTFADTILPRIQKLAEHSDKIVRYPDGSYQLVFEMTLKTQEGLSAEMERGPVQFYEFLADLQQRGVLTQVDLVLEKQGVNVPILGRHLSDGEFEFLGRMALFLLLRQPEALFMLDEPETHFNDVWKRELVDILAKVMGDEPSTVLLTTHSSIMLSDVPTDQVIMLTMKDGKTRVSESVPPLFGADPSDIMVNLFQVDMATGAYSSRTIPEALERSNRDELNALLARVGPGYWRFRIRDRLKQLDAASNATSRE